MPKCNYCWREARPNEKSCAKCGGMDANPRLGPHPILRPDNWVLRFIVGLVGIAGCLAIVDELTAEDEESHTPKGSPANAAYRNAHGTATYANDANDDANPGANPGANPDSSGADSHRTNRNC